MLSEPDPEDKTARKPRLGLRGRKSPAGRTLKPGRRR
jgi:hypothetical protein